MLVWLIFILVHDTLVLLIAQNICKKDRYKRFTMLSGDYSKKGNMSSGNHFKSAFNISQLGLKQQFSHQEVFLAQTWMVCMVLLSLCGKGYTSALEGLKFRHTLTLSLKDSVVPRLSTASIVIISCILFILVIVLTDIIFWAIVAYKCTKVSGEDVDDNNMMERVNNHSSNCTKEVKEAKFKK
ncbi:hypothetical protein BDR05DRAFT_949749 [Suillus weaverae]|nr:hypothetical protein BDR05DRAFT_949749 [Suillus weaverae]